MPPPLIIFSDLDGTLLDHATYRHDAAKPALNRLAELRIPLVLATSKTASELDDVVSAIGLNCPAIVENGAGLYLPQTPSQLAFTPSLPVNTYPTYGQVIERINQTTSPLRAKFTGFADMTIKQVADETGLTESQAARAKQRQWSEPGLWHGCEDEFKEWEREIQELGLFIAQGGRFKTVSGCAGKHTAMQAIAEQYQAFLRANQPQAKLITVALGDAPNDSEMLCQADVGIVVKGDKHHLMQDLKPNAKGTIVYTDAAGPEGWNAAIVKLLTECA